MLCCTTSCLICDQGVVMNIAIVVFGSIFSLISSLILAYVVLVSMMGPWIAPTIVLISSFCIKLFCKKISTMQTEYSLVALQTIGSVGGVVGTAIAFSFPMLYFLDPSYFNQLLKTPFVFFFIIGITTLSAGACGIFFANLFKHSFLEQEKLEFPVSKLIYTMISTQAQETQSRQTVVGFSLTFLFCIVRDGFIFFRGLLPRTISLFPSLFGAEYSFALFNGPTLWAIGFIAGSLILKPLIAGIISRYSLIPLINMHSHYLPVSLFKPLETESFILAFCSGLVVTETLFSITSYPKLIISTLRSWFSKTTFQKLFGNFFMSGIMPISHSPEQTTSSWAPYIEGSIALSTTLCFFYYFQFPFLAQLLTVFFTTIATYQMAYMSAKIGLLPFGRFSLFVMVPVMFFCSLTHFQLSLLCVFVSICGGVAADLLFDYKVGELCSIDAKKIYRYQWLGLIVTTIGIGFFLWLLFTTFQIGSPELFAKRGRTRALLIQATNFNFVVVILGALYGYVLSKCKINPALTLGGILMPTSISTGLLAGALLSKLSKKQDAYISFWSGVFASESLWILLSMLVLFLSR